MSHFDDFFRASYLRMVGYCTSRGFNESDVEEMVSDVIHLHFDDYRERTGGSEKTMRAWMNRRVMLNLRSHWAHRAHLSRTEPLGEAAELGSMDFGTPEAALDFDTPEAVLDLKQRLPEVHPLLISYESFRGGQRTRGENTSADKTRFCRERKKFLQGLAC